MRVLHVIHDFIPDCSAGSEVFAHDLCCCLRDMGVECRVFCRGLDPKGAAYSVTRDEVSSIPVVRIQHGPRVLREWWSRHDATIERIFEREIRDAAPDLVHFHHFALLSDSLPETVRAQGIPSVFTLHDFWAACPQGGLLMPSGAICGQIAGPKCLPCLWPTPHSRLHAAGWAPAVRGIRAVLPSLPRRLRQALKADVTIREANTWLQGTRKLFDSIDVITSPSSFLRDKLRDCGVDHADFRVVPHGVETFRLAGRVLRPESERPRFGFIGSGAHKGLSVLLDAFAQLASGSAELHVFGRPDPQASRRLRLLEGRGDIQCHGAFSQDAVAAVFSSFDILVVPSVWYENSPTVIREAFLSQAPVIASGAGGMAEAIRDGVDGLLFTLGDADDLAGRLRLFVDDAGLLPRLRSGIPAVVDQRMSARAFHDLYQELLGKRARLCSAQM